MSQTINCVAFDLGASGGKVVIGTFNGSKVIITEVYRFPNNPIRLADHIYWDFLRLLGEVKKGIQLAYRKLDGKVSSIGIDTWGVDCAFLDKQGQLLANPFSYRDPRTNGIMEKAFQKMPREDIFRRTGVQFMQMNTLFQLLSMIEVDPCALDTVGTFLMIPDLFNYFLTGKKYCEFTNATTTQFFDPINKNWNKSILQTMGIPLSIFPEIIEPGTLIGDLSPWLCDELGINPIPVISVATHDTASAVSTVPTQKPGYAFLSSGTWSLLGAEEESPVINATSLKYNFSSYGGVCGTWLVWKNIQALWLLQECMRNWAAGEKIISHEDIILMASRAKAFGPIIDTDDLAFFTPGDFPSRIAEFCQRTEQEAPEGQGAITRCILESLALKYQFTFDRLQEVLGKQLDRICTIGGGSRNWLLNKFTAEATGLPVIAGPAEASAIGNVMMQLIALRELDCLGSCRKVVEASFESAVFEANNSDAWEEAYGRYQEIILKSKTFDQ